MLIFSHTFFSEAILKVIVDNTGFHVIRPFNFEVPNIIGFRKDFETHSLVNVFTFNHPYRNLI